MSALLDRSRQPGHLATVADVRYLDVQHVPGDSGDLFVYESGRCMPYEARRVFTVHARSPAERGRHAHRLCRQIMVCLAGACDVLVDDGATRKTMLLDRPDTALFVPPSIWAEQRYRRAGTILMVMCDREYDEGDYIRDYEAFRAFRDEAA